MSNFAEGGGVDLHPSLCAEAESSYRYRSRRSDEGLRVRLLAAAREKPRWGHRRLQIVLDQSGEHVNHKRIYRVYRELELGIRRKKRKHLLRAGAPRPALTAANQEWALDFVHDAAESGRKFRALSVVDPYTRECVGLEADRSMTGPKVAEALERARQERGSLPESITVDNGSEFSGRALEAWAMAHHVQLCFIRMNTGQRPRTGHHQYQQ